MTTSFSTVLHCRRNSTISACESVAWPHVLRYYPQCRNLLRICCIIILIWYIEMMYSAVSTATASFSILLRYWSSAYVWVLWRKPENTMTNLFLRRCAYFSAFLLHRGKCRGVADVPYRFHLLPLRHAHHHVVECHCNQRTNWGRWYLVSIQTALRARG